MTNRTEDEYGSPFPALVALMGIGFAVVSYTLYEQSLEGKVNFNFIKPQLQVRDVIGNQTPDKFYEVNGKKVYLEVDGKPVERYFTK